MKTYEKLNTSQQNTVDSVYKHFGSEEVSQPEYIKYCQDNKLTFCFLLNKTPIGNIFNLFVFNAKRKILNLK